MKIESLKQYINRLTAGTKMFVVSNREPSVHERVPDGIRSVRFAPSAEHG